MQNYYQRPPFRQPYQNQGHTKQIPHCSKDTKKHNHALAMAYVPWQNFAEPYPPCKALIRGTVFEELDKPFLGKGGRCS